jgi:UDP-N-acetylmuramoyl-L-alanyl-D-glutamate--2,6-diaminopimelate ligase
LEIDLETKNHQVIKTDNIDDLMREMVLVRYPSYDKKNLYGITGTNGKTTSCHFIQILLGEQNTEFIGTTKAEEIQQVTIMPSLTTPTFIPIAKYIEKNNEKENFILEISSHALAQDRLNDLRFEISSFTNLSQDHLDFHLSMDQYFEAKQTLFNSERTEFAIIFSSDWGTKLTKSLNIDFVTVGFSSKDFASFEVINQKADVTEGSLTIDGHMYDLKLPISGPGIVENFLIAVTNAYFSTESFSSTLENIERLTYPEGRYQCINDGIKNIIIDYAHTPKALETLLKFSKKNYRRVTVVFGCGGNRDTTKRELMGNSAELADAIILTSDNPRDENPESIIEAILMGINDKEMVSVVINRSEAIEKAIKEAEEGEVVVIAGRGHEHLQEIGGNFIELKDIDVVNEVLKGQE